MTKAKKILIVGYVILIFLSFLYVRDVLSKEGVYELEKEKTDAEKIFEVSVTLRYFDGGRVTEYKKTMKNTDSVEGLLKRAVRDNDLEFEKISYTYGTEIESVNRIVPPGNLKWAILYEGEDITSNLSKVRLNKGDIFELRLVQRPPISQ